MKGFRPSTALLVALSVAACNSGNSTSPASDAGPSNDFVCGAGGASGELRVTDATSVGAVAGAIISAPGCTTATADDRGDIAANFVPGQLLAIDIAASGYIDTHLDVTVLAGGFQFHPGMYPESSRSSVFTGFSDTNGYLFVAVDADGSDGGPCATKDGVTVSVQDNPQIPAGYLTDPLTRSASLTATDTLGLAVLGPLAPGVYEVIGTKTGCTASPTVTKYDAHPSAVDVLANTVTGQVLTLSP